MTAFGGAVGAVPPAQIARLDAALSRRSGRSPLRWEGPGAVLLCAPTAVGSPAYQFDAAPHGLRVAGDLRIDDLDCLSEARGSTDADRLLASFRRHGPEFCASLIGDFAFALWDQNRRELFLVRDHLGVQPLFYRQTDAGLTFASEARALRSEDALPEPDEATVSAYLSGLPYYPEEAGPEGIRRLMPGHWLRWTPETVTRHRYWSLTLKEHRDASAADTFRDLFSHAVAARMRGDGTDGALLSGGMDSSAVSVVAAIASDRPLRTYSMTYGGRPSLDESRYIDTVLATSHTFRPCKIDMSDHSPLAGFDLGVQAQDGLFAAPGLSGLGTVHRRAAADGIRVLLDGHGGDEVVWYGSARMLELAAQGRWSTALSLLPTQTRLSGESGLAILITLLRLHARHSLAGRTMFRTLRRLNAIGGGTTGQPDPAWRRYLRADYISRTGIDARFKSFSEEIPDTHRDDRANHLRGLTSPAVAAAFEILHKAGADAGVELRFPFYDRRLVEFCLALPASEKMRRHETRSVLRRGLAAALPQAVLRRQDKVDFSGHLARGLLRFHDDVLSDMAADARNRLAEALNMDVLRDGIERMRRDASSLNGGEVMLIWRAAGLHLLDTSSQRSHAAA